MFYVLRLNTILDRHSPAHFCVFYEILLCSVTILLLSDPYAQSGYFRIHINLYTIFLQFSKIILSVCLGVQLLELKIRFFYSSFLSIAPIAGELFGLLGQRIFFK